METTASATSSNLLSVIVPVRNSAPWIAELLESVLAQGVAGIEVIVVDNGSVDGSPGLVKTFVGRDDRVRLIVSDATSAAAARNEAVTASTGTYLVFADSDDIVPDGAYRVMLESLEASGSDMVIGDHLKFSPTATWSPTARWASFDLARTGIVPEDAPGVLASRACWNRMFRRTFWDRVGLRFPEIASVDDIEPMTRALVTADHIDVVPSVVYLYRDRSDGGSISKRSDAAATLRYLDQELLCAQLLVGRPALQAAHARMVLDADGWAHLARFFATGPGESEALTVRAALEELLNALALDRIEEVAPLRRMLWALVLNAAHADVSEFVIGSGSTERGARVAAWSRGITALRGATDGAVSVPRLVSDGLLPVMVNDADSLPRERLVEVVEALEWLPQHPGLTGLRAAMSDAIRRKDVDAVLAASKLRRLVPLVIARADPTREGLELSGALTEWSGRAALSLVLRSERDEIAVPVRTASGQWSASLDAAQLGAGRWTTSLKVEGVIYDFPVVTARMPLPPVDAAFPIQPLADRNDGWRFLVDRRESRRQGLRGLATRFRSRLR